MTRKSIDIEKIKQIILFFYHSAQFAMARVLLSLSFGQQIRCDQTMGHEQMSFQTCEIK
jgi:hypothetical protein